MIRKKALEYATRFGFDQSLIRAYDSTVGLSDNYDDLDVQLELEQRSRNRGTVVFPYPHQGKTQSYKYGVLAKAFEARGYDPIFVIPDGCLPMSCIREDNPDEDIVCGLREYGAKRVLQKFDLEWERLSDYIPDQKYYEELSVDEIDVRDYRGVNLRDFATASTRKVTKKYHIRSEHDERIKRDFIRSAVLLVDAYENVIDSHDPVSMIAHDDKYNLGGIPLAVASTHSVYAYSSTFGWMNESLVLGNVEHRNSFPHYEDEDIVNRFLDRPLDPEQDRRVREIMVDRMYENQEARARYSALTDHSVEATDAATTVGMFTNLIWDANLEVENGPYPNVFDWIRDTISELGNRDDVELVIKPHPAESSRGTNESVAGWIFDQYPDLPENVTVLEADTDVNTYELFDDLDIGIVYNSTVGFELVYDGIPSVTAGETHYRNIGISHDPATVSEYLDLLNRLPELDVTEQQQARAKRYIYFLLEGKHLDFPFVHTTSVRSHRLEPVRDEDITESETLDQIVKRCTNGQPVLDPELDWLVTSEAELI